MQRARANRRIVLFIVTLVILITSILLDQLSKAYFRNNYEIGQKTTVIPSFFYFELTSGNSGAAFGLFSDKVWAQTFFKVLTVVALILFIVAYIFSLKKNHKTLSISLALVISGTIGNFIDRLVFSKVTDFLTFDINGFKPFAIFNVADACLSIGIILLVIHFLFLDKNALFKKNGKENSQNS